MERHPRPDLETKAGVLDRRAEAIFLDGIVVYGVVVLLVTVYITVSTSVSPTIAFVGSWFLAGYVTFPLFLVYTTGMEWYFGQTVGKAARGIVVVKEDGSEPGLLGSVARNLLRIVDLLPMFYALGIAVASVADGKRLGDLAAGTVVVHTAPKGVPRGRQQGGPARERPRGQRPREPDPERPPQERRPPRDRRADEQPRGERPPGDRRSAEPSRRDRRATGESGGERERRR